MDGKIRRKERKEEKRSIVEEAKSEGRSLKTSSFFNSRPKEGEKKMKREKTREDYKRENREEAKKEKEKLEEISNIVETLEGEEYRSIIEGNKERIERRERDFKTLSNFLEEEKKFYIEEGESFYIEVFKPLEELISLKEEKGDKKEKERRIVEVLLLGEIKKVESTLDFILSYNKEGENIEELREELLDDLIEYKEKLEKEAKELEEKVEKEGESLIELEEEEIDIRVELEAIEKRKGRIRELKEEIVVELGRIKERREEIEEEVELLEEEIEEARKKFFNK